MVVAILVLRIVIVPVKINENLSTFLTYKNKRIDTVHFTAKCGHFDVCKKIRIITCYEFVPRDFKTECMLFGDQVIADIMTSNITP